MDPSRLGVWGGVDIGYVGFYLVYDLLVGGGKGPRWDARRAQGLCCGLDIECGLEPSFFWRS